MMDEERKAGSLEALRADDGIERATFTVTGMDCGECALKIDRAVGRLSGVERVSTSFGSSRMAVAYDPQVISDETIRDKVRHLGFGIHTTRADAQKEAEQGGHSYLLLAASGTCLVLGWLFALGGLHFVSHAAYLLAVAGAGWPVAKSAAASAQSRILDINVLMSIAVVGALFLGKWDEAATVLFLFAIGEWLEGYTLDRARGSIRGLMELAPTVARLVRGLGELEVDAAGVAVDSVVRVRPGERLPLDGEVVFGQSAVNQSAVTGESMPVSKQAGDEVFAGTMNGDGVLEVRVTRTASESTIARVVEMVEEAQENKSPAERMVNRFSRWYTPAVIGVAIVIAVFPPLVHLGAWRVWSYRALVMLVAACPCALVISTPVAIVAALGRSARQGILVKGGAALEAAGTVEIVAFDKTGTLTEGLPTLTEVVAAEGVDEDGLLSIAAALEAHASHPLADAVRRGAAERGIEVPAVVSFRSVPGRGVEGTVHDTQFWLGSVSSIAGSQTLPPELQDAAARLEAGGATVIVLTTASGPLGLLAAMDRPRVDAKRDVAALRRAGVKKVAMLSGDVERAARAVGALVGVDDIRAGLLPEHKRDAISELEKTGPVAMVGDGINDAPALAAATLGIAMGAAGSDAAIEAADVALMGDNLAQVAETLGLGRRARRIIRQNVIIAIALKLAFLVAVVAGFATLWMAVLADMGATLIVTANALRLLRDRPLAAKETF